MEAQLINLGESLCNQCGGRCTIKRLACEVCGTATEGRFHLPRLARLSEEDRRFIEYFLLAEGSLKELGRILKISYPTVRNRLDKVISAVRAELREDTKRSKGGKGRE
jgi:hypothetical protein